MIAGRINSHARLKLLVGGVGAAKTTMGLSYLQDNWAKIYVFVSVSIAKVTLSKLLLPPVRKTRKEVPKN